MTTFTYNILIKINWSKYSGGKKYGIYLLQVLLNVFHNLWQIYTNLIYCKIGPLITMIITGFSFVF